MFDYTYPSIFSVKIIHLKSTQNIFSLRVKIYYHVYPAANSISKTFRGEKKVNTYIRKYSSVFPPTLEEMGFRPGGQQDGTSLL